MHDHHPYGSRSINRRPLAITLALTVTYMLTEVVGGLASNSLALLADAGHMLSDAAALALALFAMWVAERPATTNRTYGYYRIEMLAALANGAVLVVIAVFVLGEAWERLSDPPVVRAPLMLGVATGGLVMNLVGLWLLGEGKESSLNVRGAWLHVLTDALGSVGAILSAVLIWVFGWRWADPAASTLIAVFVIYSAWSLLRETVAVLMESAPGHIDVDEVRNALMHVAHVRQVHDLHVWTITSGLESLSAHLVAEPEASSQGVLSDVRTMLRDRFGIDHITIQIEADACQQRDACAQIPDAGG